MNRRSFLERAAVFSQGAVGLLTMRMRANPQALKVNRKAPAGERFPWLYEPIFLDWMTVDAPISRDYAKRQAEKVKRLGCGINLYFIQLGGPVIYKSRLAPLASSLDRDLMAELIDESHKLGIKFLASWLGTVPANALHMREHPDWQQRGPDSKPLRFICYNSPYREFLFAQVREVLERSDNPDGIYFDQLPTACFCSYCRMQFELIFGHPMPVSEKSEYQYLSGDVIVGKYSTEFNRFRRMKKKAFLWNIRQIIEAVRPNTAFVVNHLVAEECAEAGGEFIDAPMPEVVGLSATGCMDASAERQLTSLYAGNAPTWGEVKYDAGRTTSQPLAHGLVAMADVTAGVTPLMLRDLDALDTDAPESAAAMFSASRQLNDIYRELRKAARVEYAILLHSLSSFRLFEEETRASFLGIHQFLIEQHLPYRIETEETLRERGFGSAKVLVVANMGRLEAETVRLIEQFVRQGGGIVATATAGARDSDGVLSRPGQLAGLLGVDVMDIMQHRHYDGTKQTDEVPVPTMHPADFFFGRVANIEHPVIGTLRGVVIDWTGYLVEVNGRTSSEVLASALDFDQVKINAHYFDRRIPYPGQPRQPFLVVNRLDKGRTAYFAAPVCQTGVRAASDEIIALLGRAILWADAVDPEVVPLRAPMRLRITARKTPQSLLVFLNNLHTVEAPKIVGYAPLAGFDLRCDMQGRSVRRVEDQEGRPVDFRMDGRYCVVKIPRVDVYMLARIHLT